MRVVKSVSLPVELAQKVEDLPNFSAYVQSCLQFGIEQNIELLQRGIDGYRERCKSHETLIDKITDAYLEIPKLGDFKRKIQELLLEEGWLE